MKFIFVLCLVCVCVDRLGQVDAQFLPSSSPALTGFDKMPFDCRNTGDLMGDNLTATVGDISCMSTALTCVSKALTTCAQGLQSDSEVLAATLVCTEKGGSDVNLLMACLLPILMKKCSTAGKECSTCAFDANFENKCKAAGKQVCHQTYVVLNHNVKLQSLCAPSVCNSKLLTISLAKAYAKLMNAALAEQNVTLPTGALDNIISCSGGGGSGGGGSGGAAGGESYSVRSSDPSKPADPGSRASQLSAGVLSLAVAVLAAGSVSRFF